jgi:penicillin amidase
VVTEFVTPVDDDEPPILSLRWVGAEATTGFESMLALMKSRSVDDVVDALRQWPFPILNFLFADTVGGRNGRVGYHAVGRVPRRQRATYGFKHANEPLDHWDSMVAFDDMPHAIDPARDWLASANNPPWARDDPYMRSGNWADGYRARQIRARIETRQLHDIDSVGVMHADVVLGRAQVLAPMIAHIALSGPNRSIRALGEILQDWDGAFTMDTSAPTVFTVFWEQWLLRVALMRFPPRAARLVAGKAGAVAASILLGDDSDWCPAGTDPQQQVLAALGDTRSWLREHVGSRRSQWRWGRLHTVLFQHPVTDMQPALAKLLDIGPFETSGGTGTVRAAGVSTARPFVVTGLSTYRLVVDLANPGRAMATAAGGQSGHVASPNYRRQSELWVRDEYHPLLMDRTDVEANLAGSLSLVPST